MRKPIYTRVIKCKLMYETKERYDTEALEAELRRRGIELVLEEDDYMPILRVGEFKPEKSGERMKVNSRGFVKYE